MKKSQICKDSSIDLCNFFRQIPKKINIYKQKKKDRKLAAGKHVRTHKKKQEETKKKEVELEFSFKNEAKDCF
jgi:hypothetical protein